MTKLIAYLTFNGNCREAMLFYQNCLGGELDIQTIGDSPLGKEMPEEMKDCIMHSSLHRNGLVLMGSDMSDDGPRINGNSVSLLIECDSEKDLRTYYEKLSAEGKSTHPIDSTHWGALFGGLTDKFGNQWLFHHNSK